MTTRRRSAIRRAGRAVGVLACAALVVSLVSGEAAAHLGGLSGARQSRSVPLWLTLITGGTAIGASFLLASFVTDRFFIRAIHGWRRLFARPVGDLFDGFAHVLGLFGLALVVIGGAFGPIRPLDNFAVIGVWGGWWVGFTMSVYLVGDTWPALNPWRTVSRVLPALDRPYPEWVGTWPSVAGLLVLIWLEVVSRVAEQPRALVGLIAGYTVLTLGGAVVYGSETWFRRADPISRLFRFYGYLAPVTRTDDGLQFRLPTAGLTNTDVVGGTGDIGFLVAILWITTFDGMISTRAWDSVATTLLKAGFPPRVLYPVALVVGFGLFLGAYLLAARYAKATADTTLSVSLIANRFAPALLAIAAGYHLAHFLDYLVEIAPVLFTTATDPLNPPAGALVVVPGWFSVVSIAFVLVGHFLGIWAAHATAYELFPGRLQAIRSQYPFVAVMIGYTVVSLWVVTAGNLSPPYT